MKLLRIQWPGEKDSRTAVVEEGVVHELAGGLFGPYEKTGRTLPLEDAAFLAPVQPGKIIALGLNYRDHAEEFSFDIPEEPMIFMKAPSSVIGPGQAIVCPAMSERVDYEAELAIVIGTRAKAVEKDRALDYVLGYTCLNDVTARDLQAKDGQWIRAKSFDTFCPIGPVIETALDPFDVRVGAWLNGERMQHSTTANLVFDVPSIVEFVSAIMTLEPGDVIATGTPSGVGPMKPGDTVEIRIEGIGELRNPVTRP